MKKLFLYIFPFLLLSSLALADDAIEKRVLAFSDDKYGVPSAGTWFTFETKPGDVFTLSFAGSGPYAGVMILEGEVIEGAKALCVLARDDGSGQLQNLMRYFLGKYGTGGKVKVDINNNVKRITGNPLVEGKDDYISDTVLYYFLKTAQSSSSTEDFLGNIGCKSM